MRRWMICYVLLGLVQSGLVPIILPLAAVPGPAAGFSYAAFAAAGIAAPFIGAWSDRRRLHRRTLAGGMALGALALGLHALPGGLIQHMVTAFLIGLGASSASTVSTMFVVEVEAPEEWDSRISALQACISGGQLAGLLIAGVLGVRHVDATFLLGAVLLLAAVPLALLLAPDPVVQVDRTNLAPRPARGGDAVTTGPQRSKHRVTLRAVRGLSHSGLAWFLAAWLLSYTATNGLSVMFAVAMVRNYHTAATLPTTAYAIGVGISLLLYRMVARWDSRFGPWRVLAAGFGARSLVVLGMVLLAGLQGDGAALPIMACFGAMQVVWPVLSVASNTLAVTLNPAHRAESAGLLNATSSIGATIGGVVGGLLLRDGFQVLCITVLAALLIAALLAWHPKVRLEAVAA